MPLIASSSGSLGTSPSAIHQLLDKLLELVHHYELTENRELVRALQQLQKQARSSQCKIAVIGACSLRKTALIEALLHTDADEVSLPSNDVSNTYLSYGSEPEAAVTLPNASTARFPYASLGEFLKTNEDPSSIGKVNVKMPNRILQSGLILIDTPTLSGSSSLTLAKALSGIEDADGAVLTIEVQANLPLPVATFLSKAPGDLQKLFVLVESSEFCDNPGDRTEPPSGSQVERLRTLLTNTYQLPQSHVFTLANDHDSEILDELRAALMQFAYTSAQGSMAHEALALTEKTAVQIQQSPRFRETLLQRAKGRRAAKAVELLRAEAEDLVVAANDSLSRLAAHNHFASQRKKGPRATRFAETPRRVPQFLQEEPPEVSRAPQPGAPAEESAVLGSAFNPAIEPGMDAASVPALPSAAEPVGSIALASIAARVPDSRSELSKEPSSQDSGQDSGQAAGNGQVKDFSSASSRQVRSVTAGAIPIRPIHSSHTSLRTVSKTHLTQGSSPSWSPTAPGSTNVRPVTMMPAPARAPLTAIPKPLETQSPMKPAAVPQAGREARHSDQTDSERASHVAALSVPAIAVTNERQQDARPVEVISATPGTSEPQLKSTVAESENTIAADAEAGAETQPAQRNETPLISRGDAENPDAQRSAMRLGRLAALLSLAACASAIALVSLHSHRTATPPQTDPISKRDSALPPGDAKHEAEAAPKAYKASASAADAGNGVSAVPGQSVQRSATPIDSVAGKQASIPPDSANEAASNTTATEEAANYTNEPQDSPTAPAKNLGDASLESAINRWVSTYRSGNLRAQVSCYAPFVDTYYNWKNVRPYQILNAKQLTWNETANLRKYEVTPVSITDQGNGQKTVLLRKDWESTSTHGTNFVGSEIEKLVFVRIDGDWKIVDEQQVKLLKLHREPNRE